jgi:hypothetical protein
MTFRAVTLHGIAIRQSGPAQMPLMLFDADPEFRKGRVFCSAALRHGAFFHPQHNMFLSAAHGPDDIAAALERQRMVLRRSLNWMRASGHSSRRRRWRPPPQLTASQSARWR